MQYMYNCSSQVTLPVKKTTFSSQKMLNYFIFPTEGANITSCYRGLGLAKVKVDCDEGTKSCATVDTRKQSWTFQISSPALTVIILIYIAVVNTYMCGPTTAKTGCMDINYAEIANSLGLNTTYKTCYCTMDNCNSFGMNIQPTGFMIAFGLMMALMGIQAKWKDDQKMK